jgi:hypothetical protein
MAAIPTNTSLLSFSETAPLPVNSVNENLTLFLMIEKLQRFDLQLHGGELIADQPLGKEFGAQSK